MRAAIYARFSTDKQNDKSADDQRRLCEQRLPADATLVAFHADDGISGSVPVLSRPGGRALMADVLAKRVDLLLVESLDRISRDQVDLEQTVRRIERAGIRLVGVSDGYDSQAGGRKVLRTMRGLIGELYLDDLREKTHRGLVGKVSRGFVATGPSYGYSIEKVDGGSRYVIAPEQADVVREIFERYANGSSVQKIAHELNRRAVPSPRGSSWAVSAIYGSPVKGSGILNNTMYVGRLVWNRSQWLKDPDTGRRQRIDRPRDEWIESIDDSLRIVDEETWAKVRARIDRGRDEVTGRKRAGRQPRTIFGGLLRCPHCHGAVVAVDARSYGCAARKDRGPSVCPGIILRRDRVDKLMLGLLRLALEDPRFAQSFQRELREQLAADDEDRGKLADRLRVLGGQIDRLVDAIATVGISDSLATRLKTAEAERDAVREQLAAAPAPVDVAALWVEVKARLQIVLASGDPAEIRAGVTDLLGPVLLRVDPSTGHTWGDVAVRALVDEQTGNKKRRPDESEPALLKVVAGAGFEPATFGL
ncbi:recombinase family protein [Zeimonas arvi]|uniref:Recombinase family protein n=1 Tax=Zeimonas arvi TaxID=2498847 RepID=A0A5C8NP98_9BURK|nr:recombinase family protein [Zeimonas arvi]TXL63604.1 recombinase family protein [Zeimonas arvi]